MVNEVKDQNLPSLDYRTCTGYDTVLTSARWTNLRQYNPVQFAYYNGIIIHSQYTKHKPPPTNLLSWVSVALFKVRGKVQNRSPVTQRACSVLVIQNVRKTSHRYRSISRESKEANRHNRKTDRETRSRFPKAKGGPRLCDEMIRVLIVPQYLRLERVGNTVNRRLGANVDNDR